MGITNVSLDLPITEEVGCVELPVKHVELSAEKIFSYTQIYLLNLVIPVSIYDIGAVAMLAIGVCVVFVYNKRSFQTVNKIKNNPVGHMVQPIKSQKQRSTLWI